MKTVVGKVLNASGAPVQTTVTIVSQSTPVFNADVVTANSTIRLVSNSVDGAFSLPLEAGIYSVTYDTPSPTQFRITVPSGSGSVNIGDIKI